MLKVELIGLGFGNLDAVAHINGNDIECMMGFSLDEMSQDHRDQILNIMREHLAGISTRELINKLPR